MDDYLNTILKSSTLSKLAFFEGRIFEYIDLIHIIQDVVPGFDWHADYETILIYHCALVFRLEELGF